MRVRGWLKRQLADEVVIHTTENQTIRGWLEEVSNDGVILRAARYLEAEASIELGGEVFVPRSKIAFVQVRPAAAES